MNKQHLPIRVKPFNGQCIRDYVSYLAEENGWGNKQKFLTVLGITNTEKNWTPNTESYRKSLSILSNWINDNKAIETKLKPRSDLIKASYSYVGKSSHLHQHPRFCVYCIRENAWLRQEWRITLIICCRKHGVLLTDTCPVCHTQKTWLDSDRFSCVNCEYSFLNDSSDKNLKSDCCKIQDFIDQYPTPLTNQINTLARPIDLLPGSVSLSKLDNKTLFLLFSISAYFLSCRSYRKKFITIAVNSRTKLDNFHISIEFSPHILKQSLEFDYSPYENILLDRRCPLKDFNYLRNISSKNINYWITPKRISHSLTISSDEIANQCDTYCLAEVLHMEVEEIGKLIKCGLITPLRSMRTNRDMLFNIHEFNIDVKCIPLEKISDPLSWKIIDQRKYYQYYNTSMADVIEAVYSSKLITYSNKFVTTINNVIFSKKSFDKYFEKKLLSQESDISIKDFAKVLGIKIDTVGLLLRDGLIYANHWQNVNNTNNADIKIYSITSFLQKYICANRVARLNQFNYKTLVNHCLEMNIQPDITYPGTAFYSKSTKIDSIINQFIMMK